MHSIEGGKIITIPGAKLLRLAACFLWTMPLAAEQPPRAELITGHRIGTTPPMANYSDSALSNVSYSSGTPFEGPTSVGYVPPDTNISVGNNQIVETVNVDNAVFEKSEKPLQAQAAIHAIFRAAAPSSNDICTSVDGGDSIVLFDKIDQRWIISQLAYNMSFTQNHLCLAISNTADATGSYTAYDISFGRNLPDYPQMGIWAAGDSWGSIDATHSGVYFSANMFSHGSSFIGAAMCSFRLSNATSLACVQNSISVYSILPADLEGSPALNTSTIVNTSYPAPAGTAEYFMQFSGNNTLSHYQFTPDYSTKGGTVTGPLNIKVASFQDACGGGACVPQSGTSTQLDSLGDRLIYRLSYRNYGTSSTPNESLVVTQSVQNSSSSNQTGVRWYQLTKPYSTQNSGWGVAQQGTFGPSDGIYRWMGSIAQDKAGDLGIGYSVSSPSMWPGTAFTGRAKGDAKDLLEPESMSLFKIGNGYQTSVNRWGDYLSMSVDPCDDCTMWFATEYLKSTGSYYAWGTKVTNLSFSTCFSK